MTYENISQIEPSIRPAEVSLQFVVIRPSNGVSTVTIMALNCENSSKFLKSVGKS
jgi:hypothetical protein